MWASTGFGAMAGEDNLTGEIGMRRLVSNRCRVSVLPCGLRGALLFDEALASD